MRLLDFARNVHSQTGEDGVLEKVLQVIGNQDRWCVEFGAWDGEHLSNTRHLIVNKGYHGVLIEADPERFENLQKNCADLHRTTLLNRLVGFNASDGLDAILQHTGIPKDFDLLSIDIDGNDYHVWAGVSDYKPKVVCIEYNPTIPNEIDFVQPPDLNVCQGASLAALCRLAAIKGYELVAVTMLNAIFVRTDLFPLFGIADNRPANLREDTSQITHIFCGYDGTVFISGHGYVVWHGIKYQHLIAQMPSLFRYFPDNLTPRRRTLFKLYKKVLRITRQWLPGAFWLNH